MGEDPVHGDVGEVDDGPEYDLNFRNHPEHYRHTADEQGAFKIEPYKSELLPDWTVADLDGATTAAESIHDRYREYRDNGEFVGMDMARKYLQMGWTRAMRYAKYPGGQKYVDGEQREPQEWYDPEKREIALAYKEHLDAVREDPAYEQARQAHAERYGES
ncbi:hypothetical protein BVU17_13155 [Haloarcula taiwanensis]|uniref:DUF4385 domain-containing protein n=1 Tax=Haloarcula taiwanensis TaxID=1932004 RepID=A0A2H5A142_9EURY|nr:MULTISPECIES: DUF4385 family protein [Haloarcula]AUG48425.1 hypothetical protein BVU17_13155 [Haloarcula taiwanensis]RLM39782.1 DUF4385 family protein [Haloarcula sp. Atlit-120R]RLM47756.1 DUF4385 family protein [Haloarcula sp. Atlit-47R]RLM97032.1 DUF4385 family protein [Haloarcula sp. Atlit-7R]